MGKKSKQIYNELLAQIRKMNDPAANPAQQMLTNEALGAANWLKAGDFSQLPKGMFFDFEGPAEQLKRYNAAANVSKDGTFALGQDSGGMAGRAMDTQSKYLGDKFARDVAQNYQNNIANVRTNAMGALQQSAGATSQNQSAVVGALSNLYQSMPKGNSWLGGLLSMGGSLGAAALNKF